jgi:hypothetical protein
VYQLESSADDAGAPKQGFDLFWGGVGGDVKVFGFHANDEIANRATDDVGIEPLLLQDLADFDGMTGDPGAVNAVLTLGDPLDLAWLGFDQSVDQSFDGFYQH